MEIIDDANVERPGRRIAHQTLTRRYAAPGGRLAKEGRRPIMEPVFEPVERPAKHQESFSRFQTAEKDKLADRHLPGRLSFGAVRGKKIRQHKRIGGNAPAEAPVLFPYVFA